MRPRNLKIVTTIFGMRMPIATVKIAKFADVLKPKTELQCPKCGGKPKWEGKYVCGCGEAYRSWTQLKRVLPDGREIKRKKLNENVKEAEGEAYIMDREEFAKFADATMDEYGVVVNDEASARNLKKLLIALTNLGKVILIRFNDTYEQRIAVLTLSLSNRIILKEIIPLNLADIRETMMVDLSNVSQEEISEAEQFIKMLPKASEKLLYVDDYRALGVKASEKSPRVMELEQIIAKAKQK